MNNTMVSLVAAECKFAAENESTLETRLAASMKAAKNHWMVTDEQEQFNGAVAAVFLLSDDDTKERIRQEIAALQSLNAMLSGVPVDLERIEKPNNPPIGLVKMWREVGK